MHRFGVVSDNKGKLAKFLSQVNCNYMILQPIMVRFGWSKYGFQLNWLCLFRFFGSQLPKMHRFRLVSDNRGKLAKIISQINCYYMILQLIMVRFRWSKYWFQLNQPCPFHFFGSQLPIIHCFCIVSDNKGGNWLKTKVIFGVTYLLGLKSYSFNSGLKVVRNSISYSNSPKWSL
jgi:hypothetical protein